MHAGGLVETDTYQCSPATCETPTCLCASNSPPGGLTPQQIPQFILVSRTACTCMRRLMRLMQ